MTTHITLLSAGAWPSFGALAVVSAPSCRTSATRKAAFVKGKHVEKHQSLDKDGLWGSSDCDHFSRRSVNHDLPREFRDQSREPTDLAHILCMPIGKYWEFNISQSSDPFVGNLPKNYITMNPDAKFERSDDRYRNDIFSDNQAHGADRVQWHVAVISSLFG